MSLYLDTSALLKRYIDEAESDRCVAYLLADTHWISARHTMVEVRRNIHRLLAPKPAAEAVAHFQTDWRRMDIVELDAQTCEAAAQIAEVTGARTLDALHLAAVRRVGGDQLPILTYDIRQAQAARQLGLPVLGG